MGRMSLLILLAFGCALPRAETPPVATFSIVGFDPETGDLGIAVQSKFLGVGVGYGFGGANDRYIDLRVEDHKTPIRELARLLELHKRFFERQHKSKPKAR